MKSRKICRIVFKQTTKNTYLAKYYVLFFVSLSLLHISSVAARNTNSCNTTQLLSCKDSYKTDFKILEFIEYAWNKKAYPKEAHTTSHKVENIHQLYIIPFFKCSIQKR